MLAGSDFRVLARTFKDLLAGGTVRVSSTVWAESQGSVPGIVSTNACVFLSSTEHLQVAQT